MRFTNYLLASLALAAMTTPALAMGERPSEPNSGGYGTSVPEPGMFGIMGLTLAGLAIARRRRRR